MPTIQKYHGKMYTLDRVVRTKKDAEELARDWQRDGDKIAIVRKINEEYGSRELGTYEIKKAYAVYWRRK